MKGLAFRSIVLSAFHYTLDFYKFIREYTLYYE